MKNIFFSYVFSSQVYSFSMSSLGNPKAAAHVTVDGLRVW